MRRTLLLLVMLAGLALVLWSGVHNLRARRAAQQTQANRAVLVPDGSTPGASVADSPVADSPLKGKPAPAFTLADLNGGKVSLSDFHGHPLVINYWATYCEPCKYEMPWLEEFSHKYAAAGIKVVGIDFDTEVGIPTILKNVQKLGATYPILLSTDATEKAYLDNLPDLPVSFYVDKTGKITDVTVGVGSKNQLESMFKKTVAAGAE